MTNPIKTGLRDLKRVVKNLGNLPEGERVAGFRGLPTHVFDGTMMLGLRSVPPDWYLATAKGPKVLLVHGYAGHPRSHGLLQRHLRDNEGVGTAVVDLRDAETVRGAAKKLTKWMETHVEPSEPVTMVAHSLGGLTCRLALMDPQCRSRVGHLITLGTPHHGTQVADLIDERMANTLERNSELLDELEGQLPWDEEMYPPMTS